MSVSLVVEAAEQLVLWFGKASRSAVLNMAQFLRQHPVPEGGGKEDCMLIYD